MIRTEIPECKTSDCRDHVAGKSKYCKVHKKIARENWKRNVMEQEAERAERYERFARIADEAYEAGLQAAKACTPNVMIVTDPRTGHAYEPVSEGPCGFAEIRFAGNTSFGHWAKKNLGARKAYGRGVYLWVSMFGQSHDRKAAYARAYAQVLRNNDIDAWASSRLD